MKLVPPPTFNQAEDFESPRESPGRLLAWNEFFVYCDWPVHNVCFIMTFLDTDDETGLVWRKTEENYVLSVSNRRSLGIPKYLAS